MDATITAVLGAIDRDLDEPGPAGPERRAETYRLLERLRGAYLESDAADRTAIRASIAARRDGDFWVMREFARRRAEGVTGPGSAPTIRLALAAVSIEDCDLDYRDTWLIVDDLYARANKAGIDADPLFAAVAALSTDRPTPGGCDSVARILGRSGSRETAAEREA